MRRNHYHPRHNFNSEFLELNNKYFNATTTPAVGRGFLSTHIMKIYIAGKITGLPTEECQKKFALAEERLKELGANPVNPFKLGIPHHFTFQESKPHNFKALLHCQGIFMLTCWKDSPGAKEELAEAIRLKQVIFFEESGDYDTVASVVAEQTPING